MKISCIIVDDEPLARKGLEEYVSEVDFLELKAQCENSLVANKILYEQKIDLMLLDIKMPKLTGIDFLKTLSQPPVVILTTAYSEYALQGYELDVIDYLLKPVSFERFLKAVNKVKDFFELKDKCQVVAPNKDYFFVRCDKRYEKILYNDLLFAEAMENYVVLNTKENKFISYLTFKAVEEYLPKEIFIKVHKSFIVSISNIDSISTNEIKIGSHNIPISRNLKDEIMNKILNNKLLKR
jgi:DNA-binding LytR/AlgR family response regulator